MKRPVKVLCAQCERLLDLEVYRVEGPVLVITCSRCGAESRVEQVAQAASQVSGAQARPASMPPRVSLASTEGGSNVVVLRTAGHEAVQSAAKAADEGPCSVPEGLCPQCIAPRGATPSCPHCGVLYESFDETMVQLPQWLHEEWVQVLRDWANEAKHSQLRRMAQQGEALAALGRLYRLRQAAVPEDPVAAEGRADVLRLAAMGIALRPVNEDEMDRRRRVMLVGMCLALIFIVALGLLVGLTRPR